MPLSDPIHGFKCIRCHACCRQSGYVRLKPDDIDAIADFLKMDVFAFTGEFTRLTRDRQTLALKDQADGSCIFLTPDGCRINPVKPGQCRDFPHKWKFSDFHFICGWARLSREK